jgi:MFS transporter, putative metabolite:H+ symporter
MILNKKLKKEYIIVLVAALGYFVDAYDLILFVVIRKSSLIDLGIETELISKIGLSLFNVQMVGTLVGGVFFGIMGDKRGRLSVLFGSILVYSIANILNAGVSSLWQYYVLRFIAGFGLAGELGAGITLVSEVMPQKYRGYGTAIVAASGAFGAFTAGLLGDFFYWRWAFLIGGCMGLLLLLLRMNTFESGIYKNAQKMGVKSGDFMSLFLNRNKFRRYFSSILISLPVFFVITILMQLAPEIATSLNISKDVKAGTAVMFVYLGLTLGDLSSGLVSQWIKNRKITIRYFLFLGLILVFWHLNLGEVSLITLHISYILLGFGAGYWVNLITLAAEQFGTNLRATVATTLPNFARGAVIPISFMYQFLNEGLNLAVLSSALFTGLFCYLLAFIATFFIEDTFNNNLDFTE